jgi:hypothetical protein
MMEWITVGLRSILRPQLVAQVMGRLVGHTLDSSYASTGLFLFLANRLNSGCES